MHIRVVALAYSLWHQQEGRLVPDFFFFINEVLWGSIAIYPFRTQGISWFTWRSGLIQFLLYPQIWQKSEKQRHPYSRAA